MCTPIDVPHHERWARLRFAIIGPLLAAPPPNGALQAALAKLAAKTWRHPVTGLEVRSGVSTRERWYYAARPDDGQWRRDAGRGGGRWTGPTGRPAPDHFALFALSERQAGGFWGRVEGRLMAMLEG